jgi:hypothetical protein
MYAVGCTPSSRPVRSAAPGAAMSDIALKRLSPVSPHQAISQATAPRSLLGDSASPAKHAHGRILAIPMATHVQMVCERAVVAGD